MVSGLTITATFYFFIALVSAIGRNWLLENVFVITLTHSLNDSPVVVLSSIADPCCSIELYCLSLLQY